MKNKLSLLSVLILSLFLAFNIQSCKKNRFKKTTFLEEFYTLKIAPDIETTIQQFDELKLNWLTYTSTIDAANLSNVKQSFTHLLDELEKVNFYNLGDVGATYVFNRAYKTKIDSVAILTKYNTQPSFDASVIAGYTNAERGIFTLEYLLFSPSKQDSLSSSKFINFIGAQLDFMEIALDDFKSSWQIYYTNFIASVEDDVSDSYNIVVNRIIVVLEDLIEKRITLPIDNENAKLGVGHYSNRSFQNIKTQIVQLRAIYLGEGTTKFNSIYTSIRKSYKELANRVTEKFDEIILLGNEMTGELDDYIYSDLPSLNNYKTHLVELLTLFKIDVQQELDIVITFNGSDGD